MAYTSQHNSGRADEQTFIEIIRDMLRTVGLPNLFWAEAAKTVCYIVNWSTSTAIRLKTLMEMWTRKLVDYSHLHIFECPVYVMYNAQEKIKLDLKFIWCIFLGYANGVNCIICRTPLPTR